MQEKRTEPATPGPAGGGVEQFEIPGDPVIRGWSKGSGRDLILCHGLSATRDFVVHGSDYLSRNGYRVHSWDARGHGESDPAPPGESYDYRHQADDLGRVVDERTIGEDLFLAGHSMGAHTVLAWTLGNLDRVTGIALIGPVYTEGREVMPDDRWDERAHALEQGGPEEFARLAASEFEGEDEDRETIERIALDRTRRHLHPEAVAQGLREVPRSRALPDMDSLGRLEVPTLIVGSHDTQDPGHPLAVAALYAELIPSAELVVEGEGEPPLAWQGGRLSRVLADFFDSVGRSGA